MALARAIARTPGSLRRARADARARERDEVLRHELLGATEIWQALASDRELATIGDYAEHVAEAAAAIALVTPEADEGWRRESIAFDLGQCAQNLQLAAWALGVGTVHAAVYDEDRTRELLGYPEGWRCDYLLSLGYPERAPTTRGGRKALGDLVHRERW